MNKIDLYTYVATKNPREANQLLYDAGYKNPPTDASSRALMLADLVRNNKEKGLLAIAEIHPDKDLIISYLEDQSTANTNKEITKPVSTDSGCKDCSGMTGKRYFSANGDDTEDKPKRPVSEKMATAFVIGGVVLLTGIIVSSIIVNAKTR